MNQANPNPVDATIRAGQNLQAQPVLLDHLTRQRNMTRDLRNQTSKCRGLVASRQMQRNRLLPNVVLLGRDSRIMRLTLLRHSPAWSFNLFGKQIAQPRDFKAARDNIGSIRLAHWSVVRLGLLMLIGDTAHNSLEQVFDGDQPCHSAVLVYDPAHMLLL